MTKSKKRETAEALDRVQLVLARGEHAVQSLGITFPNRTGVRVPARKSARNKAVWVWIICRFCNCEDEVVKGMIADRTRMCLWCYSEIAARTLWA